MIWRTRSARQLEGDALTRSRVEEIRLTSGKELEAMFAIRDESAAAAAQISPPAELNTISPGMLMRLRGRVTVAPDGGKSLTAPLTSRPAVIYSASVSYAQDIGVHRPPVAFHSAGTDFALRIESDTPGSPPLDVMVSYRDVKLFNMVAGRHALQETFAEASAPGRTFIMSHLVPGSDASSEIAASSSGGGTGVDGLLDFRECVLAEGQEVTAVGEVVRDGRGGLRLCPWTGDSASKVLGSALRPVGRLGGAWFAMTSWERGPALKYSRLGDPAVGTVMVSDDPSLLVDCSS
jgi:hypothetical protein